ncbi:hypothetical protein MW887_000822 [Aspergillus wentii]|nr:hypothetical protein MW887_000822 [Aspergillus wentii]
MLLDFPNEILLLIAENLHEADINSLARANGALYCILDPFLYRYNVHHSASRARALNWAVLWGSMATIHKCLDVGAATLIQKDGHGGNGDITGYDNGFTKPPLIYLAAFHGRTEVVKLLLDQGANPNTKYYNGTPVISHAIRSDKEETVRAFLDSGKYIDLEARGKYNMTPLAIAARLHKPSILKMLLASGRVDVEAEDEYGATPVILAAITGNAEIVAMLAERNADLQVVPRRGRTALSYAARFGHLEVIEFLCNKGVDPNIRNHDSRTPLFTASKYGRLEAIRLLIAKGADPNAKDLSGNRPILLATKRLHQEATKLLIEYGAECKVCNDRGQSTLFFAARLADTKFMDFVIEKGFDINTRDRDGRTALHLATGCGDKRMATRLLEKKADINAVDQGNMTALHYAVRYCTKMVKFLLKNGIDQEIRDQNGHTAYDLVDEEDWEEYIEDACT